jgi:acetylornithine deacetylase/succinyl-diaminopimelate desuccinylase-like protein
MGLRGIVQLTVALHGPRHDLHSGMHGGVAPNPATELARLVASLHGPDGSIAVDGYYGAVTPPTDEERRLANASSPTAAAYEALTGVPPVAGERQFTPAERLGFRPSIDINGIHSGFGGKGVKTIIPAYAMAKITARLVPDQDPDTCLRAIVRHLEARAPVGLRFVVEEKGVGGSAFRLNARSPLVAKAKSVLDRLTDKETAFLWEGASVPIVAALSHVSGAEPLLVGFGREADRIHAPDESFSLEQFKLGYLYVANMLSAL